MYTPLQVDAQHWTLTKNIGFLVSCELQLTIDYCVTKSSLFEAKVKYQKINNPLVCYIIESIIGSIINN